MMIDVETKIANIEMVGEEIKIMKLQLPKEEKADFFPGQFVMLSLPNDSEKLQRAYSIASSPTDKDFLEIAYEKVGKFTSKLFELKEGDAVLVKGPFGHFSMDPFKERSEAPLILLAAGTGITPLMSIMRYIKAKSIDRKVYLLYSCKTPDVIIYKKEIEEMKNLKNFNICMPCTRMQKNEEWKYPKRRIDVAMLKEQVQEIEKAEVYMCGAPAFVNDMKKALNEAGVQASKIYHEQW